MKIIEREPKEELTPLGCVPFGSVIKFVDPIKHHPGSSRKLISVVGIPVILLNEFTASEPNCAFLETGVTFRASWDNEVEVIETAELHL